MLQAKNSHMPLQFPSRVFYSLCWSGRWGSVDRGIKELRHTDSVMFDDRERHEKYWPLQRVKSRPSDNEDAFSHDWCRINSKSCVLFRSIHSQHITQHEVAFEFAHRDISAGFAGLAFIIFHVGTILSIKWNFVRGSWWWWSSFFMYLLTVQFFVQNSSETVWKFFPTISLTLSRSHTRSLQRIDF